MRPITTAAIEDVLLGRPCPWSNRTIDLYSISRAAVLAEASNSRHFVPHFFVVVTQGEGDGFA